MTVASSPSRPRPRVLLCVVLGLGAALRLYHYAANPSLFVDDAMLTINVASRSFWGLLRPLAMEQTAPPGFLWALKLATVLGGVRDPVVRLVPLAAGLVVPYATWRVARRLVTEGPALVAAAFAALAPIMIGYSVTVKPYMVDALVTLVLVGLTLDVLDRPGQAAGWWRLAAGGVAAVLCSTPAVFVLAGCGAALVASPGVRQRPEAVPRLATLAALWLGVFAAIYVTILRPEATPYMRTFWAERFLVPAAFGDPRRVSSLVGRVPVQPFVWEDHPDAAFAVLLWTFVAFGVSRLARRGAAPVAIVVGPVVALLIASAFERYPVAPRVCLFAAPLFFLIDAAAVDWALARWPAGWPRRGVMMVTSLWVVTVAALGVSKQYGTPPTRLQVEEFKRRAMPGEPVYVFAGAVPTWTRYSTDWHAVDRAALTTIIASQAVDGGAFHNAPSRGRAVDDTAGTSLLVSVDGRVELLGLASGVQWRESFDVHRDRPDPGWGEREAARLRAVTDSTAWIAIAYAYPGVARVLLDAIERAGGREEFHWSAPPALLMRYRFPPHERKFFVPAP